MKCAFRASAILENPQNADLRDHKLCDIIPGPHVELNGDARSRSIGKVSFTNHNKTFLNWTFRSNYIIEERLLRIECEDVIKSIECHCGQA
jgi:hypothetical protein